MNVILEGGNAVQGVDRIPSGFIQPTVEQFSRDVICGVFPEISSDKIFLTGSTGQKPDSGDIDICVDISGINGTVIENLLKANEYCVKNLQLQSYLNTFVFNMIHIKYPQVGSNGKFVQVDLMFTKNPDFVKFYSCGDVKNTKYKLAHRNILLDGILYAISNIIEKSDEDGNPLVWLSLAMESNGIFKEKFSLLDFDGSRLMWENDPVLFGMARRVRKEPYMSSPKDFMHLAFGNSVDSSDIDNFEKCFSVITSDDFKFRSFTDEIMKYAILCLKDNEKLDMPEELNRWI